MFDIANKYYIQILSICCEKCDSRFMQSTRIKSHNRGIDFSSEGKKNCENPFRRSFGTAREALSDDRD